MVDFPCSASFSSCSLPSEIDLNNRLFTVSGCSAAYARLSNDPQDPPDMFILPSKPKASAIRSMSSMACLVVLVHLQMSACFTPFIF